MVRHPKISVAFGRYFAESGPDDKRDAIVVYRAPSSSAVLVRGRLRELKKRLDSIKESAGLQRSVQTKLFRSYQRSGSKGSGRKSELAFSAIGKNTLPIAWIEVTPNKLEELAGSPD